MIELKKRLFQFISLVIYVQLLNIPFLLILHVFIKDNLNLNYEFISLEKIYKTKQASKINNSFINIHSKTIL